ncbi:P-loop containing nucleoside triphosphate hydrolase protein [Neolentinus lepideus HHB14362 ss-1]|uniref:Guanine nucleotide-binding protein-like 1 n=1 Tax=Neolentinus lepideus HHB14362 ss-1 TaxID=1314782 RepID=A0A165W7W9_9AGAM|nr:P-loop containing nucleoside triphosphate hydrolase protein [Neolentinus lepideus HHB14362 ss-1]
MPRRKPISAKQRKADLQLKRAIKRGDVPSPQEHAKSQKSRPRKGHQVEGDTSRTSQQVVDAARKLQSSFIKVSPQFLAEAKELASNLPLPRPIPIESAIFSVDVHEHTEPDELLTCPKRPKWRYDMTKKEVEKNEEGLFGKWLNQTDTLVEQWRAFREAKRNEQIAELATTSLQLRTMPASPTYFERNLEVWRQLWRVTELSQIILVLLDTRCPLLHFPPSLSRYLENYSSGEGRNKSKKIILVLTKVDMSGATRANAWERYLRQQYPYVEVIQVESYYVEPAGDDGNVESTRRKRKRQAHLPQIFRKRLVDVLNAVHEELCQPPEKIRDDPDKLAKWKPSVRRIVDWNAALQGVKGGPHKHTEDIGDPEADCPQDDSEAEDDAPEPEYLTIGLIGQPNVGKSSLINALLGESKVRASKTPGKTKHFQTLFLTPEIRFVDCPGLVMPNYIPLELQVLSGILPISHISSIPSCIHYTASLLPFEQILNLVHALSLDPEKGDKRTWRKGMQPRTGTSDSDRTLKWTAMDILTAYANYKGWVTAKAGRPDIMRAGNAILRLLAEGRIHWAFLPPLPDIARVPLDMREGDGIWVRRPISRGHEDESSSESEPEDAGLDDASDQDSHEGASDDRDGEEEGEEILSVRGSGGMPSRFGVLALGDDDDEEGEGGEDEDESKLEGCI